MRSYGGQTAADRQADRRARLLDAGLEVYGTTGYASASVRRVCARAGLTERYFYESFTGSEALFREVYEAAVQVAFTSAGAAVGQAGPSVADRSRAGLAAFIGALAADRRLAHVLFISCIGVSPTMELRRREVQHAFAAFVQAQGSEMPVGVDPVLVHRALVGGVTELLVDWTLGLLLVSVETLVEHCVLMFTVVAAGLGSGPDDGQGSSASSTVRRATATVSRS